MKKLLVTVCLAVISLGTLQIYRSMGEVREKIRLADESTPVLTDFEGEIDAIIIYKGRLSPEDLVRIQAFLTRQFMRAGDVRGLCRCSIDNGSVIH